MVAILSISGQNRHLSTEHNQYQFAGSSSTRYRGIVVLVKTVSTVVLMTKQKTKV